MVNALDMQVVVSTVPPTLVEEKKDELIRWNILKRVIRVFIDKSILCMEMNLVYICLFKLEGYFVQGGSCFAF